MSPTPSRRCRTKNALLVTLACNAIFLLLTPGCVSSQYQAQYEGAPRAPRYVMSSRTKKVLQTIGTGALYVGVMLLDSYIESKVGDCDQRSVGHGHHHHHHH